MYLFVSISILEINVIYFLRHECIHLTIALTIAFFSLNEGPKIFFMVYFTKERIEDLFTSTGWQIYDNPSGA